MSTISCTTDSDCDFNFYCSSDQTCLHDSIWPPSVLDVITYLLIPIVVGIGNVGGLGGGIVKVPMIMLMLNYQTKIATFISYCILFGSCLANSTLLIFKKHPLQNKPIIDYNIVLMINPMVLLGTNIGIFLNILLPEIVAGLLFICFLILVSPYMYKKGLNLYRLKKEYQQCQQNQSLIENDQENEGRDTQEGFSKQEIGKDISNYQAIKNDPSLSDQVYDGTSFKDAKKILNYQDVIEIEPITSQFIRAQTNNQMNGNKKYTSNALLRSLQVEEEMAAERSNSYFQAEETNQDNLKRQSILISQHYIKENEVKKNQICPDLTSCEQLEEFYKEEYKQVPTKKLILLIVVFFSVQMLVFIRGGKGLKSFVGITTCSISYWITNAGILLLAIIAVFAIRFFLLKWEKNKKVLIEKFNLKDEFADNLDVTNNIMYLKISMAGLSAGILAGTFGVGAGLALVPILLASRVNPQVAAATCGFNYFFISTTTIIQVFTNSYLDLSQIILFSILSFIGGFVIAKLIYSFVERKKASYLIVFIVFGLAILNIISFIIYLSKKGVRYGWDSLINQIPFCEAQ
ncbi:hypothetical protein ABPG72_012327 [Tetrahymena utriculariae]